MELLKAIAPMACEVCLNLHGSLVMEPRNFISGGLLPASVSSGIKGIAGRLSRTEEEGRLAKVDGPGVR